MIRYLDFIVKIETCLKTEKFGFILTLSILVLVAIFNLNRTEIFGYCTGLLHTKKMEPLRVIRTSF